MALNTNIRGEQIKDATITGTQIATSVAGDGLAGGGGSALSINVDDSTIETNADAIRVKANGIGSNEIDLTATYDYTSGVVRVATPSGSTDATNKSYVDGLVNGLDWKSSCRLASEADSNWTSAVTADFTTGTLTLAVLPTGASRGLIDSVEPVDGDRILIKDAESVLSGTGKDAKYNGLWEVTGGTTTTLTLTRTTDADADAEVTSGLATFVEEGTVNADRGYTLTSNDPITVDTTAQVYTQFTGLGAVTAGVGLTKSADTIDLDLDTLSAAAVDVSADEIAIVDATDGSTKKESIADLATGMAGAGIVASSGALALDINELGAVAVDVANDLVAIEDATDSSTKKESIADIITAVAGVGLAASSGVLAVDLNELSTEATFDPTADLIAVVDATDSGSDKALWSVIATAIAGSGITATNGVLSADSVTDNVTESDFVKNVEIATGSQTVMATFSGSAAVVSASVQVYLNGLLQEEGAGNDYTIVLSTGVVTFLTGLVAGDIVTSNGILDN